MGRILIIVLIAVFLTPLAIFADQKQDKEAVINEISAYSEKKPAILITAISALGDAYAQENKIDEAMELYKKALNIVPEDENLLNRMGMLYNQKADYEASMVIYEKLSNLKPDNMWYLQMLSESLAKSGKKDKADGIWKDLIAKRDSDANLLMQAANFYSNENNMENAISLAEKALKLDANNIGYTQNIASFYAKGEKFDKAEEAYKKVLNMAKDQWLKDLANTELLNIYQKQNRIDEVLAKSEADLEKNQGDINSYKILGELCIRKGDNEKALSVYEKAVKSFPGDRNINNRLVDLYETQGKFNEAALQLEKIIKIAPSEIYLLERLANLYERLGKKEEAKKTWEFLISKVTIDPSLYSRYAEALYKLGDLNGAITQLKKAQETNVGDLRYTLRSAAILIDTGKIEEAKVALGKVIVEAKEEWVKNEAKRKLEEIANMKIEPKKAEVKATETKVAPLSSVKEEKPKQEEPKKKKGFTFGR